MRESSYRIHVVAQKTGLGVGLIRAWERRYGVLKPRRSGSGYRLYSDAHVEVLKRLKQLTEDGVSIGDAVKLKAEARSLAPLEGGAQVDRWLVEITAAAERFDQPRIDGVLDEALASLPPLTAIAQLLLPALRVVGDRWHAGQLSVASEHLITHAIRTRLLVLLHAAPVGGRRHAICACFPNEQHELGLLTVALQLRHAGYRVTYLGARTPARAVGELARALRPDLVALAAVSADARAFKASLAQVVRALPQGIKIWIGGAAASANPAACLAAKAQLYVDEKGWQRALA